MSEDHHHDFDWSMTVKELYKENDHYIAKVKVEIVPEVIRKYNMEGSDLVEQDTSKAKSMGMHLLKRDLATVDGERIRHNPDVIAASIVELICEDLKFKDMQNNPEYMILNDKLKFKKKKIREDKKNRFGLFRGDDEDKKSRFFNKYEERINSIKKSEEKAKRKSRNAMAKNSTTSRNAKREKSVDDSIKSANKRGRPAKRMNTK